jgi:uncharacterized protein (TIGR03032 family)
MSGPVAEEPKEREVRFEYSRQLVPLLKSLHVSLLISTYQAGKLVVVGVSDDQLVLSFHNFDRPMGLAVRPDRIAVGTRNQIWVLQAAPDIAGRIEPPGQYDGCYLARSSYFTGDIESHELAWGENLWVVNTLFSCLCKPHERYSFEPHWRPPFVTALVAEDRCHLNGLALDNGRPEFVTALSETDVKEGWRPVKTTGGCIIEVATGRTVARGFAMPHSPRLYQGRFWLLNSGFGRLITFDPLGGAITTVAELPGYTRGLAFHGRFAFVGLSKIRETAVFGGMPIAERRAELKCGVGAVDLATGRLAAHLEFMTGVEEIFAVAVLPGMRLPYLSGPHPDSDGKGPIWTVPV